MSFRGYSNGVVAQLGDWCGRAIGFLLCGMAVFSPWAFGTTEPWSIHVMNIGGWTIGTLFLARRLAKGSATDRLNDGVGLNLVRAVAVLTVLLLGYVLVGAVNAAAHYVPGEWRLDLRSHVAWLPHSFDGASSWKVFWRFLALAGVFWGAWDWLSERRRAGDASSVPRMPSRWRLLLWVLVVNGAVLAAEAIVQRASGTPNLLWFQPTRVNQDALTQLGPFAYRANGAQFLNLLWPAALGFWWWLNRDYSQRVTRRGRHHVLLPCVAVMAAAALFSLSRAGVAVAALLVIGSCILLAIRRGATSVQRWALILLMAGTTAGGIGMSWNALTARMESTADDPLRGRREIYQVARTMAADSPVYGLGAGTFDPLFQMYRRTPEEYWPGQVHDDWLELRITLGWAGLGLAVIALALSWLRPLTAGGVPCESTFLMLLSLALAGCLLHAKVDFPFQIYSIQFLFLVLLAMVFSASRA